LAVPSRFKKIALYGVARAAVDGMLAVRGLVLATALGPHAFGAWALFRLATNYATFAQLGMKDGLEFHVARAAATHGAARARSCWRTALGFVLCVSGSIAVASLALSFVVGDATLALSMRWFAGAVVAEQVWLTGLAYIRATGNLRDYAAYEVGSAVLQLTLAALLAPVWGLSGAYCGFVLATVITLALVMRPVRVIPALSRLRLISMLNVGLPVVVSLLIGFMLATADRLVVAAHGNMELLGLYALAFSLAGIAGSLALVVRVIVYPEVFASVAALGEAEALRRHLAGTVVPFATFLPPVLGGLAVVLGPVMAAVLPQYLDAVPAARLLIFIGVTAGFERLGALGVVAAGRQRLLPLLSLTALALNVTLSLLALRLGLGLEGVAGAAVLSNAAFGLGALAIVARVAHTPRPRLYLGSVALPLTWCLLSTVLLHAVWTDRSLAGTAVLFGIYAASIVPLLPLARRQTRIARAAIPRS